MPIKICGTLFFDQKKNGIGPMNRMYKDAEKKNKEIYIRYEVFSSGYIKRLFGSFEKFEDVKKILLQKNGICFHEIIKKDDLCKLFFDLDFKKELYDTDITFDLVTSFQDSLELFISENDYWEYVSSHPLINTSNTIILDIITSNKIINDKYKISIHLLCNQIVFQNILEQKKFISSFCSFLQTNNSDLLKFIDVQLYKPNSSLRTIYSAKADENRMCIPQLNPIIVEEIGEYSHDDNLQLYFIKEVPEIIVFPYLTEIFVVKKKIHKSSEIKYEEINISEYLNYPNIFSLPCDNADIKTKTSYIVSVLDYMFEYNRSYFDDGGESYKKRLRLTFSVADYLEKDEYGCEVYLTWLRNKRTILEQTFELSLDKYRKAYHNYDKTKSKNSGIISLLKLAKIIL